MTLTRPFHPRKYQSEANQAIWSTYNHGARQFIWTGATGAGKTVIGADITYDFANKGMRGIWLVHKEEILLQTVKKHVTYGFQPGIIKGKENMIDSNVFVAMVQTLSRGDRLDFLLKNGIKFDYAVIDECVTGDTLIETENGKTAIKDLNLQDSKYVLSYDGERNVLAEIEGIKKSTRSDLFKISFTDGSITCTPEHLFFTNNGWKKACEITKNEKILYAPADAGKEHQETRREEQENSSKATEHITKGLLKNGKLFSKKKKNQRLFVNVGVGVEQALEALKTFYLTEKKKATIIAKVMINALQDGITYYRSEKELFFLERSLVTEVSDSQTKDRPMHGLRGLMESHRKSGLNTKSNSFHLSDVNTGKPTTRGMAIYHMWDTQNVCRVLQKSMISLIRTIKRPFPKNGLRLSMMNLLHGGIVTTGQSTKKKELRFFTPKDSRLKKMKRLRNIFLEISDLVLSQNQEEGTSLSGYIKNLQNCYFQELGNLSQSVCSTNWATIQNIEKIIKEKTVYDLSVKETHCYFTNGILSHNCHHGGANQWIQVTEALKKSNPDILILGLTATPQRTDKIGLKNVGYTHLINGPQYEDLLNPAFTGGESYLTPPLVIYSPLTAKIQSAKGKKVKGDFDKKNETEIFSEKIVVEDCVNLYNKYFNGAPCIIFGASVEDCVNVSSRLIAEGWKGGAVYDKMDAEERKDFIEGLGNGKYNFLASYEILGEGVDVPVTAGCIKRRRTNSIIIEMQQNGRPARKYPGKKYNLIIDQCGNSILHGHPLTRREWTLEGLKPGTEADIQMTICPDCNCALAGRPAECPYCGCNISQSGPAVIEEIKEVPAPMEILPAPAYSGTLDRAEIEEFQLDDQEQAVYNRIKNGQLTSYDRFGELARMIGKDRKWTDLVWRKFYA